MLATLQNPHRSARCSDVTADGGKARGELLDIARPVRDDEQPPPRQGCVVDPQPDESERASLSTPTTDIELADSARAGGLPAGLSEEEAARRLLEDLVAAAHALHAGGARRVVISRGSDPVIFLDDGNGPSMIELAAIGVGLARTMKPVDAVLLGMAAGALNITRRGLGTGTRDEIERLATQSGPALRIRSITRTGAGRFTGLRGTHDRRRTAPH